MENEKVFDELTKLNAKLSGMEAAMKDEDDEDAARREEEDARREEEDAARHRESARKARDEDDDEDAKRHEEEEDAAHTRAFKARMKAAQYHATMAAKRREEEDEEDAKRHEDEAKRHEDAANALKARRDEDEARRREEDARREEEDAASKDEDDGEEAMSRFLAMFMRASRREDDEEDASTGPPLKRQARLFDDEDSAARLMARMMKAMTFQPGVSTGRKRAQAAHADEAQDKALIQRMLRQKGMKASSSPRDQLMQRRLRNLEASMELLTDTVKKAVGLLTDATQPRGLVTDRSTGGSPNGGSAPTRRSMAGGGEVWADKYATTRTDANGTMSDIEATAKLVEHGITDPRKQIERILEYRETGRLALN